MIRHTVVFRFAGSVEERRDLAERFAGALRALPALIDELVDIEVGLNCNPAEDTDLVLVARAATLDDVAAYSAHPAHQRALDIVRGRIASRMCVDSE